jgi:hypothetical protein
VMQIGLHLVSMRDNISVVDCWFCLNNQVVVDLMSAGK